MINLSFTILFLCHLFSLLVSAGRSFQHGKGTVANMLILLLTPPFSLSTNSTKKTKGIWNGWKILIKWNKNTCEVVCLCAAQNRIIQLSFFFQRFRGFKTSVISYISATDRCLINPSDMCSLTSDMPPWVLDFT